MYDVDFNFDVAILGAGAAGLMAAIRAAETGESVALIEKNRRPGVKILMSGGTRCNLTNARGLRNLRGISGPIDPAYDPREALGSRSIQQAFGENGKFLAPALKAMSVESTIEFFESEGVATYVEGNGKVFPVSNRASDVLDALLNRLGRTSARIFTHASVSGLEAVEGGFLITLPDGPIRAQRVVVAVGGQSFPGSGTTGDGYGWARRFGHTIVEPRPALVPLKVDADWVPGLQGLTIPDLVASIRAATGPALLERREAMLFAHFGLTGPAILDVSRAVARHDGPGRLDLVLDFLPEVRIETLDQTIQTEARNGRRNVVSFLPDVLPRRLAEAILTASSIPLSRTGPELSRDERRRLVGSLKSLRLPVSGTIGFAKAEVTSGGVSLAEVDPTTLESRLQPGLHFAGEVLDLDGLSGGYNFQAAWSLGWLVGGLPSHSTL
jgi:predicted Rossmann fold flavoprotein